MGRWATYPTTTDSLRRIEISFLKKYNYLNPDSTKSGQIIWTSQNGDKNTIGIIVTTLSDRGSARLYYTHNGDNKIDYTVQLVTRPSNLGKGVIWYFVCPKTGRLCRNLYLYCGYFLHRSAFGLMYDCQIESKRMRCCSKLGKYWRDEPYQQIYSRYFKTHYRGKPTKRYTRLNKVIDQAADQEILMAAMLEGMERRAQNKTVNK